MSIHAIYGNKTLEEMAKARFAEERAINRLDGWFLIKEIQRVSKPGRRVYASVDTLPTIYNGLGISILSTPKGVMSDAAARNANVGGEVLCTVF